MSIGSVQHHHKHIHQQGTPITMKDPASGNNVPGSATTSADKALMANNTSSSTPAPTLSPNSSIGHLVDKSA